MPNEQSRRYTLTINNPTDDELAVIGSRELLEQHGVTCFIGSFEHQDAGTKHLQLYAEFKNKKRAGGVCAIPAFARAHVEAARGTYADNVRYISKELQPFISFGEPVTQGKRTDLDDAIETMEQEGLEAVARDHPKVIVRHYKGLSNLKMLRDKARQRVRGKPHVSIYIGPTRCGKSRLAHKKLPNAWWDSTSANSCSYSLGYSGERSAVFDDFYSSRRYKEMLDLCDRYPRNVNAHGVTQAWLADNIIITSNQHPRKWWRHIPDTSAFAERVNKLYVWNGESFTAEDPKSIALEHVFEEKTCSATSINYRSP